MPKKDHARRFEPRPGSHLVVVLPDLHVPYHDHAALDCALLAHEALAPRRTVILGDWLDCAAFSAHPKGSAEEFAGTFKELEVDPTRLILDDLERSTDEIDYLGGNHEDRIDRACANNATLAACADLIGAGPLLAEGRAKPFRFVPYVPRGEIVSHVKLAEDLLAVHGWSFAKHAAAQHLTAARHYSLVHGHTHRAQSYSTRDPLTGRIYTAWSPGCLSKLQPLYQQSSPTEWVHGFSLVWVTDDLTRWTAYSPTIGPGGVCVLPDGRKVDARAGRVA